MANKNKFYALSFSNSIIFITYFLISFYIAKYLLYIILCKLNIFPSFVIILIDICCLMILMDKNFLTILIKIVKNQKMDEIKKN